MWTRYALEAPPNAIVHRWLIITAILSVLPLQLIAALVISRYLKTQGKPVYGRTDWADRQQMADRGISATTKLP